MSSVEDIAQAVGVMRDLADTNPALHEAILAGLGADVATMDTAHPIAGR